MKKETISPAARLRELEAEKVRFGESLRRIDGGLQAARLELAKYTGLGPNFDEERQEQNETVLALREQRTEVLVSRDLIDEQITACQAEIQAEKDRIREERAAVVNKGLAGLVAEYNDLAKKLAITLQGIDTCIRDCKVIAQETGGTPDLALQQVYGCRELPELPILYTRIQDMPSPDKRFHFKSQGMAVYRLRHNALLSQSQNASLIINSNKRMSY